MSVVLDLSKKFEINLQKAGFEKIPTMQTRLAIDKSGSMNGLFRSGFVEKTVELFMGAASKFDDNGQLEYTFFDEDAKSMSTVSIDNYKSIRIPSASNGTNYVPALKELVEDYTQEPASGGGGIFGKIFGGSKPQASASPSIPTYIGFITDGEPNDLRESAKFVSSLNGTKNYVQFIVLGRGVSKSTMESLKTENSDYAIINDPNNLTVDELYSIIANPKLANWVKGL
jgi:hypothetical protein